VANKAEARPHPRVANALGYHQQARRLDLDLCTTLDQGVQGAGFVMGRSSCASPAPMAEDAGFAADCGSLT
jgi:hypothetical protein